jgi:hypothetical protein
MNDRKRYRLLTSAPHDHEGMHSCSVENYLKAIPVDLKTTALTLSA